MGGESDEEGVDSELLDSDEDEIDDEGQAYLESLQEKVNKAAGAPFKVTATMGEDGDSDSDEEDEYDGCEETSLEAYPSHLLLEHSDHVLEGAGTRDLAKESIKLSLAHENTDIVKSTTEIIFVELAILVDVHH